MKKFFQRIINFCGTATLTLYTVAFSSQPDQKSQIIVERFSHCKLSSSKLPDKWYSSRNDISMYHIKKENENKFLRIDTRGGCTSIGKKQSYDAQIYPLLSWRWRMHKLPEKGNENYRKTNDSGAAIYVIFKGMFRLNTILKYVWSSTLPQGTETSSPYNKRTKVIVLRSGKKQAGTWINETVNIVEDYRRLFNQDPPAVEGIGILSDADNTNSTAKADYDDIIIGAPVNISKK